MAEPKPPAARLSCVVAATPRTGTWLLSAALHATELVGVPEEYFQASIMPSFLDDWDLDPDTPIRRYIRQAIARSVTDNGVFSTKMHWAQLDWLLGMLRAADPATAAVADHELLATWLPHPRYVHMWRRDTARQAISYYRATQTRQWFVVEGDDDKAPELPHEPDLVQIRWCEDMLVAQEASWQRYFAEGGIEPFDICYEDFVGDYERTVRAVLDYLPVELPSDFEVPPPGVKQQSDDTTEAILAAYLPARDSLPPMPPDAYWSWEESKLVVPAEGEELSPSARPGTIDLPNT